MKAHELPHCNVNILCKADNFSNLDEGSIRWKLTNDHKNHYVEDFCLTYKCTEKTSTINCTDINQSTWEVK